MLVPVMAPYIDRECYPDGPNMCSCGHHEGYHNGRGTCMYGHICNCVGMPKSKMTPEDTLLFD